MLKVCRTVVALLEQMHTFKGYIRKSVILVEYLRLRFKLLLPDAGQFPR
jgi:hypothetical protein